MQEYNNLVLVVWCHPKPFNMSEHFQGTALHESWLDQSTICREPPTHLRLLPVRHFVGIAPFPLNTHMYFFSHEDRHRPESSCELSEFFRDDG